MNRRQSTRYFRVKLHPEPLFVKLFCGRKPVKDQFYPALFPYILRALYLILF
jgi:hypothetical protein